MQGMSSEIRQQMGGLLYRLVEAAERQRKEWLSRGDMAMRYYRAADYSFDYKSIDDNLSFKARVSKTWEAFTLLIRHLNPVRPERNIVVLPQDYDDPLLMAKEPYTIKRLGVVNRYLNWSIKETDFTKQTRRTILDYLARGRGVMWTGVHPRTGIVSSFFDSVVNHLKDPDAQVEEDVKWSGRIRVMTRQQAARLYPESQSLINQLRSSAVRESDRDSDHRDSNTSDCVKLVEIWMLNGLQEYKGGAELAKQMGLASEKAKEMGESGTMPAIDGQQPMKYVIGYDDHVLIHAGPWELPWYMDSRWPCEELVSYDEGTVLTPMSPLHAAMGFQQAINWIVTLMIGRFRTTSRLLVAVKKQNGEGLSDDDMVRALLGNDIEALAVPFNNADGTGKLADYLETFNWDNNWITPSLAMLDAMERKFEEATGITKLLQYGEGQSQDRSAAATRLRERTAFARIDDMGDAVLDFHSQLGRKEAIALQYLKDRRHIAATLGQGAAKDYGFLADTSDPQELIQKGMTDLDQIMSAYTLEDILREAEFTIDVGTSPRQSRDDRIGALDRLTNQMLPTQIQSQDPEEKALAYDTIAALGRDIGLPVETIRRHEAYAERLRQLAAQPPPALPAEAVPDAEPIAGPGFTEGIA